MNITIVQSQNLAGKTKAYSRTLFPGREKGDENLIDDILRNRGSVIGNAYQGPVLLLKALPTP